MTQLRDDQPSSESAEHSPLIEHPVIAAILDDLGASLAAAQAQAGDLADRLAATRTVGEAVGLIMAQYQVSDHQAEDIIDRLAVTEHTTDVAIATRVIRAHDVTSSPTAAEAEPPESPEQPRTAENSGG